MPNGESGQSWDPKVSKRPLMPEDMVPYYQSYIPVAAEGYPERAKAAFAALERRDQMAIEAALFPPDPPEQTEKNDVAGDEPLNKVSEDDIPTWRIYYTDNVRNGRHGVAFHNEQIGMWANPECSAARLLLKRMSSLISPDHMLKSWARDGTLYMRGPIGWFASLHPKAPAASFVVPKPFAPLTEQEEGAVLRELGDDV